MNEDLEIEAEPSEIITEVAPVSRSRFDRASRQQRIQNVANARAARKQRRHPVPPAQVGHVDKVKPTPNRVPRRRRSKFERIGRRALFLAVGVLAVGSIVNQFTEPSVPKGTIAIERIEGDIARHANSLPGLQVINAGNGQVNEQVVTGDETLIVSGEAGSNGRVNPSNVTSANIIALGGGKKLIAGVQLNTQSTSPADVAVYAMSDGQSISAESSSLGVSETAQIAELAKGLLENPNIPQSHDKFPKV